MFTRTIRLLITYTLLFTILSGCALPGLSGPPAKTIKIGTFDFAESSIMGRMVKQMVERNTDLSVEMVDGLGSAIVQHKAMKSGDIDISATRYTGSELAGTLGMELVTDPQKAMNIVQTEFKEQFDQVWFDSYGFANSYAFTVTEELAKDKGLETVSDLESVASSLKLGVDSDWMKRPGIGYEAFKETYEFDFQKAYPMQVGLVYQAVDNGKMDVVLAYTTDGRLEAFNLTPLEDDKNFFPPYDASPVVRQETVEEHPEIKEVLQKLSGQISTEEMRKMNYQADVNMKEPSVVAKEFLEKNNYFE
ncbi:osmoprotectant ABC transporter substrate-binding protein [Pontibacillus salicampi]|uniref:Osmoprotectant ABC transporter substrate-binding protein n=1 Tax=Pontibacillus salicampi TaxID=1449801 RepID=A0ABV6LMX1_9BACI